MMMNFIMNVKVEYNLHHFDCSRAINPMSWGVEARVPFLDKSFLEKAMVVHPNLKLSKEKTMEKHILRSAFDCNNTQGQKYLPKEILWRQKEQFSDGVGYNWIDDLKKYTESSITDEEMAQVNKTYEGSEDIPRNKEELFYRKIFDKLFPNRSTVVPRWIPRTDWDGVSYDPSGRAQKVHNETTKE